MANLFVFRIVYERPESNQFIREELSEGRLRQGWGGEGTSLLENSPEEWIRKKCSQDVFDNNEKYYQKKQRNLWNMLNIKKDDMIIIPKTPDYSQFTICKASGTYTFEKSNKYSGDDFQHVIPIDVDSIRVYNYHANENCKIIRAKMRAYQSPINNVWNELMIQAAEQLLSGESNNQVISTAQSIQRIIDDILPYEEIQRFRNLGNREVEKIVQVVFENMGYECIGTNSYDREGGDADLIFCDNTLSELYEISENGREFDNQIFVQIKNKTGLDNNDIEGVEQLIKRSEGISNATKILISTADDFTDECINLAKSNGILLINGKGFLRLVFRYASAN